MILIPTDKEKQREYKKKYNAEHRDQLRAYQKKYRQSDKGRAKACAYSKKYRDAHKEEINRKRRLVRENVRQEVISHYGGVCQCCGESDTRFLTIDHINGDGAKHRREDHGTKDIYMWLKRHVFPDGFQVLCFNCNMAKSIYGECPHVTDACIGRQHVNLSYAGDCVFHDSPASSIPLGWSS